MDRVLTLKEHWLEYKALVINRRVTLKLDNRPVRLFGVTIIDAIDQSSGGKFKLLLITNGEWITVSEENPWRIETINTNH